MKELKRYLNAGAGVIHLRTRERDRVLSLLTGTFQNVVAWDILYGWRKFTPTGEWEVASGEKDPLAALMFLNTAINGTYVMAGNITPFLKAPAIIEALKQHARALSEVAEKRLIVITPESVFLSEELRHDIPVVDMPLPSQEELKAILASVLEDSGADATTFTTKQTETISSSAAGMTGCEAELAYSGAIIRAAERMGSLQKWDEAPNCFEDFNSVVLGAKTEVLKQSEILELMKPVSFNEVGGLDRLKDWIKTAAKTFTPEALAYGCDLPKGIAAVGPPGTGKTLIGKAIATTLGQPLVKFDVSRCYGSLVGESEGRVRVALNQLEAMGRVVVLFDEIDKSLGGAHQSGGDSGVSKRVLGAILTFMQETKAPIFPIYTANRVAGLPPELLRKGRLDEVFAVLPPNRTERREIFKIHLRKRKQDAPLDLTDAVNLSEGFVSSEIEGAVKEAVKWAFCKSLPCVTEELLCEQLREIKPISKAFAEDFAAMEEWAKCHARLASSPEFIPTDGEAAPPRRRRSINSH